MKKINNQRDYNVGDCCPPLALLSSSWWVSVTNRKARINSFIDEESVGVRLYGHGNDISANRRS